MADEVSEDRLLGGRLRLRQPRRGHRAGTDAVLLAGLAPVRPGDHVIDLGSASGAVGLMIAARAPDATVVLLEREAELVGLARDSIALNGLGERVRAVEADAFSPWPTELAGSADLVVTNPPYYRPSERVSPHAGKRAAHVMDGGDLDGWLSAAAGLLRSKGRLCVIHRADAVRECLAALGSIFGSLEIIPVHARAAEPATRIVLRGTKGGKAPTCLGPALLLHGADGRFTPEAEALHRLPGQPDLLPRQPYERR